MKLGTEVLLPLAFPALAVEDAGKPVIPVQKTVSQLGDDEVLVHVEYASINNMDAGLARRNLFQLPAPYVLGFDFSGVVVRIGSQNAAGLKVGDPVFGGTIRGGCFAEYVVVKNTPDGVALRGPIPSREASTYGIAFLTAYESLEITADLRPYKGKWMYIAGAGGGLGHFAVQMAKLHGLKVIGSAGKTASLHLLRELGLDAVIDYSHQDVVAEVLKLTGGKGADVVYDPTYRQASYNQSTAVVAAGGLYIRLGTPQQLKQFGVEDMTSVVQGRGARMVTGDMGRYSRDPDYVAQTSKVAEGLRQAARWYQEGTLRPIITGVVPFQAGALQQALEDFSRGSNNVGKLVVELGR